MKSVKHRFLDHKINPATETLIIGTFNPDTINNQADFFYSRGRNYLWTLLPSAFSESDLKNATKEEKTSFIERRKIDFVDLISEVEVEEGQEANYYDGYIDSRVKVWRDVISEIKQLKSLKRVCFTRKTFSDIPNMKKQVEAIQHYCVEAGIYFQPIVTPARYYNHNKQTEWSNFLLSETR